MELCCLLLFIMCPRPDSRGLTVVFALSTFVLVLGAGLPTRAARRLFASILKRTAPQGVDGTILEANPAFATMLGFGAEQRHKLVGRTLFSLTTPRDIQSTLKAVSKLLSGEIAHSLIIENCYRQDGNPGLFRMEMNCMWKANKAQCFVCFIRPAETSGEDPHRTTLPFSPLLPPIPSPSTIVGPLLFPHRSLGRTACPGRRRRHP